MKSGELDSFIEIELYQDTPFSCGQPLYGTVHLYAKDNIPNVGQVLLTLQGEEQVVLNLPDKASPKGLKAVTKIHPIVNERFVLFDYAQFENSIIMGSYSYPFTLYLPDWLPQSHLCFNNPDPKKPGLLNTFKIRYNLVAAIMSSSSAEGAPKIVECEKQGLQNIEMQQMLNVRRLTILTPEYSEALLNQEIKITSKIRSMGLMGSGTCSYTCKFEKDVLYPNENVKLTVEIDNSKCSKKIEKYKIKLLRRTQVFNLKNSKQIYTNDHIVISEKVDSKCEAKKTEKKDFEFRIPQNIFLTQAEEDLYKIPLIEKSLAAGPSSSLSGRLYKVQYVLQFSLKHNVVGASQKTMPEAQIPVMIMTPSISCVQIQKPKIQQHPGWEPYAFECIEFSVPPESEEKNEYCKFRRWLIKKEMEFVAQQQKKQGSKVEHNFDNDAAQQEESKGGQDYQ
mmetsp:Transcript_12749/g.21502  ORF Transcript_12749/g.21502 Transcript_12749/m.21502 type:complete len:450 (+) Transcript_12749:3-1352(+)